jgi:hypothetical protein
MVSKIIEKIDKFYPQAESIFKNSQVLYSMILEIEFITKHLLIIFAILFLYLSLHFITYKSVKEIMLKIGIRINKTALNLINSLIL